MRRAAEVKPGGAEGAGRMYVKEVSLEGFKSYAQRTVVSGFDRCFNAITGLNGSGKSNILDSICFVLGITNLQQVRATSLQELVYKNGQAGVSKATVSVLFDNSDRSRSPIGFEDVPEITVTRQVITPPPAFSSLLLFSSSPSSAPILPMALSLSLLLQFGCMDSSALGRICNRFRRISGVLFFFFSFISIKL